MVVGQAAMGDGRGGNVHRVGAEIGVVLALARSGVGPRRDDLRRQRLSERLSRAGEVIAVVEDLRVAGSCRICGQPSGIAD